MPNPEEGSYAHYPAKCLSRSAMLHMADDDDGGRASYLARVLERFDWIQAFEALADAIAGISVNRVCDFEVS